MIEQELIKFQQQSQPKVKPRKIKPHVVKRERVKVKRCNSTAGPCGSVTRRRSPKQIKTRVVKVPTDVNLKQCSVVLPADLDESGVKTRSAHKGRGKAGKGLKAKQSKSIDPSPDLSSDETDKPIEPNPVIVPQLPINSDNEMVMDETTELTADSSTVVEPNQNEFDEPSELPVTSSAEIEPNISVNEIVVPEEFAEDNELSNQ